MFWQLAIETEIHFDATIADIAVDIDYHPLGKDPLPTIGDYVEMSRISAWDIAFFHESAMENGVHKNLDWEKQLKSMQAMKRVIFTYYIFTTVKFCTILKCISFFVTYIKLMLLMVVGTSNTCCFLLRLFPRSQPSLQAIMTRIVKIACIPKSFSRLGSPFIGVDEDGISNVH